MHRIGSESTKHKIFIYKDKIFINVNKKYHCGILNKQTTKYAQLKCAQKS